MPNNSSVTIACALCIGATPEPFLAPALAAIADSVDVLVVNDNSRLARSENVATLERSAFATDGRLRIERHPFVDFADMRNRAFAPLRALATPPDWVLFLDADEVHGEQLRYVARQLLPRVSRDVAHVDAYTYHFFGTFRWITDVARRLVAYRFAPELRWINAVHERITGMHGSALTLPYIYHHYGNVVSPALLARKHARYYQLGNPVTRPPTEADATASVYLAKAAAVRPYRSPHPHVARATIARIETERSAALETIEAGFAAARNTRVRIATTLAAINETLRVELRRAEHPGLFGEPTRGR